MEIEAATTENMNSKVDASYIIWGIGIAIVIIVIVLLFIWMRKRRKPKKMYVR
ncbi:hypothetical protein [Cellulosilyticum ruminicola]|uniref:hypothetical protein n=1 Tax=Cellulosilyticum ruminicola TaxID=425254 RepID=UPI00155DBE9D|nr:hypothetical protein [Cellulosilyticum ruminicola]